MEYDGENRRAHHWHLEKSISIGHIITTIAIAGSVLTWAMRMDTRVSIVETQIHYSAEQQQRLESSGREGMNEIKAALIRIENKIDRKADKP
jgi:ribose 1,5-bisphosphokinase PhnN